MVKFCLKMDQLGCGADVVLGRMDLDLCPIAAVLSYIACQGNQSLRPQIGLTKPEFVREFQDGLSSNMQVIVLSLELLHQWALAGMEDSTIQLLGQWQSVVFLRYIRTPHECLASLSLTLASQGQVAPTLNSPPGHPRN